MITLRLLIAQYPGQFYSQNWYDHQAFMDEPCKNSIVWQPRNAVEWDGHAPMSLQMVPAVDLAMAYIKSPNRPIWKDYLWTASFDDHEQRVFVGDNGYGLEIHRHLDITGRWKCPIW